MINYYFSQFIKKKFGSDQTVDRPVPWGSGLRGANGGTSSIFSNLDRLKSDRVDRAGPWTIRFEPDRSSKLQNSNVGNYYSSALVYLNRHKFWVTQKIARDGLYSFHPTREAWTRFTIEVHIFKYKKNKYHSADTDALIDLSRARDSLVKIYLAQSPKLIDFLEKRKCRL
jgi:hypothetical protein